MKQLGIILLLVGIGIFAIFGGAGFIAFFVSPEVPLLVKVPASCIVAGILLLIIAVAKETWGKKDKYERIEK